MKNTPDKQQPDFTSVKSTPDKQQPDFTSVKSSQLIKKKTADRNRTIALLGTSLFYDIPISIFRQTRELSQKLIFNLLYFAGMAFQSSHSFDSPANILYNLVTPRITDGIIIISNLLCSSSSPPEFREFCLRFHPLPVVSLGMAIESIPSVIVDNAAGMYDAVCHLIDVHHHTRIAFLSGPRQHNDVMERFAGFTRAMETHGLPVDKSLLVEGTFEQESGATAVSELLDNRRKIPGEDIQAIVCCNDYMAIGVIVELQKRGIVIPDQIAVTGFDDIVVSGCMIPPLSTVHYPFNTLTTKATDILIKLIERKSVPKAVSIRPHFIPRHSCGCPDALDHTDTLSMTEDLEQLLKNTSFKYPEYINSQLLKIGLPVMKSWKQALTHLRLKGALDLLPATGNHLNKTTIPPEHPVTDYSNNKDQTAWEVLGRTAYTTFNYINYQTTIHNMERALTSTLELPEFLKILTNLLPEAEIRRCCLCLYENPENFFNKLKPDNNNNEVLFNKLKPDNEDNKVLFNKLKPDNEDNKVNPKQTTMSSTALPPWSRLVLSFNKDGIAELPPGGMRFATSELLSKEIIKKHGWQSWVILPLYYKQEQFGYILMDSETSHEHFYWSIRNQISGTLKEIHLLEETRKANEQKTQFFINVAHETKTPLTLIQNYLSLYMKKHQPDEHLAVIEQNINILLKNMLNFLDVEKLQKGNTIYQHDTLVDLSESAHKKSALFQVLADKKNISIKVYAENNILIRSDALALDRIFNNILDNAVKYIQPGGRIMVDVLRRNGKALLRISDNGPGLPVETFDHIFEPYYLLSQKKTSKQGIGVGLSIVKKIIDELGAGITVEKCRGGGVCFSIYFTDSTDAKDHVTLQEIPETAPSYLINAVIKERNISPDKPTILIVDDNVQLLQFIQASMEHKYSVYLARDVSEALFKLKTIPLPSLIISDIMMDKADGFTLLAEISEMEGYNYIPFIFLTAMSSEKERIKGLGMGAVDYIEKPFSISELDAKIDSLISLRKRQKKHDMKYYKNRLQGVIYDIEQNLADPRNPGFENNCKKYGIRGRETEIIKLLMDGLLYKEIAAKLNISLRTVEYSISKIYKKCDVSNKSGLFTKFLS
ncbi:MAG: substrate-binding domain-containing protein [Spirochaetales bacterium]|nr:substrate-binding domain-containing protein [Spirochaetales bacterium]